VCDAQRRAISDYEEDSCDPQILISFTDLRSDKSCGLHRFGVIFIVNSGGSTAAP
jgi:hypothetical protein